MEIGFCKPVQTQNKQIKTKDLPLREKLKVSEVALKYLLRLG
jgi:hypothetical protein